MPLPRHALKHNAVPSFSGNNPEFTAWTSDARYYAKGVGFLSAFVSDPPQYIPVGELDTEKPILVDSRYSRKRVLIHALGGNYYRRLSRATRAFCIIVPRQEKRGARSSRGTALKRRGQKSDLSRRLSSFTITPGSNPLEEMGRIEDLASEMRTAQMTLDDHMLYTIFIDARPAEYEVEARNLASRDSIGRDYVINGCARVASPTLWKQEEGVQCWPCRPCYVRRRWRWSS